MTRPEQSGERRCPEPDARGGKNWVLGVTALASFMMVLDGQVITTAFATIRGEFGASVETLQMDGQWLQSDLRGAAADRCCAGRPLRPPHVFSTAGPTFTRRARP